VHRLSRRLPAFYLAAFFAAVAAAPHHHLDALADILSDGPSNSGTIAQILAPNAFDAGVYPGTLVEDEPCLACFSRDFVAAPAVRVVLTPVFARLTHHRVPPILPVARLLLADASSRAPPPLA
jgi:hypothetical protein